MQPVYTPIEARPPMDASDIVITVLCVAFMLTLFIVGVLAMRRASKTVNLFATHREEANYYGPE